MAAVDAWTVLDTNDGSAGYLPVVHRRYALPDGTEAVWDIFRGAASVANLAAAERELLEETGYTGQLELAGSSWLASSALTRRHVVIALNAKRVAAPSPEPGEFVEVVLMAMSEFRGHLRAGDLTDVDLGYLALDHLGLLG